MIFGIANALASLKLYEETCKSGLTNFKRFLIGISIGQIATVMLRLTLYFLPIYRSQGAIFYGIILVMMILHKLLATYNNK